MDTHWKEILPVDRFIVQSTDIGGEASDDSLLLLYQPLIGYEAQGLYQLLKQLASEDSHPFSHHYLMSIMQMRLPDFLKARKRLEGIGLLEVFQKENGETREFLYELKRPLSPRSFFGDSLLNIYLYSRLGHTNYQRVKKSMEDKYKSETGNPEYERITRPFNSVYESVPEKSIESLEAANFGSGVEAESAPALEVTFDFDVLAQHLSSSITGKEFLTPEVKAAINKLAFIYSLEPLEMSRLIQRACQPTGEIDIQQLRKTVQSYYRMENDGQMPALSERVQPAELSSLPPGGPKTEEDKQILEFETRSPYDYLTYYSGGASPTAADLKLIEDIMFDQNMPPGVMNVLLHYVMITNDNKLTRALMERIAGHWTRSRVKTVKEAMKLARNEQQKYKEWQQKKADQTGSRPASKNNSRDIIPKWMKENEEADKKENEALTDQEAKRIRERMKNFLNQ